MDQARLKTLAVQLVVFATVGGLFNVFYGLLYVVLREGLAAQSANTIALVVSTIAGTWGHRRITFGVKGMARTVPHQALGLALLVFSLVVTAGSLWLLQASVEMLGRPLAVVFTAAASGALLVGRSSAREIAFAVGVALALAIVVVVTRSILSAIGARGIAEVVARVVLPNQG